MTSDVGLGSSGTCYPTFTLGQLGNLSYFIEMINNAGHPVFCISQVQSTALICAGNQKFSLHFSLLSQSKQSQQMRNYQTRL